MESPSSQRLRKIEEQILTTLRGYGIAGEVALANPARPASELAKVGIAKGYTTIVAIGGDRTINGVATAIQNSNRAAMGIIPLDACVRASEIIGVGADSPLDACEILRMRTIVSTDILLIDPAKYVLTEAHVESVTELPVRVHIDDVVMETMITRLSICGDGSVELINTLQGRSPIRQTFDRFMGHKLEPANVTHMKGKYIKVETNRALPIKSGSDTIAKTPFVAAVKPDALKLIVKRDKVRVANS